MKSSLDRFNIKLFVAVSVSLTCLLFYFSAGYYHNISRELKITELSEQIDKELKGVRLASDIASFWAKKLNRYFNNESDPQPLFDKLATEFEIFHLKPEFIVFDQNSKVFRTSFDQKHSSDWEKAAHILKNFKLKNNFNDLILLELHAYVIPEEEFIFLRKLFGNLFFPIETIFNSSLRLVEFNSQARFLWLNFDEHKGAICFFSSSDLTPEKCVQSELERLNKTAAGKINYKIKNGTADFSKKFVIDQHSMMIEKQLDSNRYVCAEAILDKAAPTGNLIRMRGLIVLMVFFMTMMIYPTAEKLLAAKASCLNIRRKFILIFLILNILPALPLAFMIRDFLNDSENALFEEIRRKGLTILRNIDDLLLAEKTRQIESVEKGYAELLPRFISHGIRMEDIDRFEQAQNPKPWTVFLAASSSASIFTPTGIVENHSLVIKRPALEEFANKWHGNAKGLDKMYSDFTDRAHAIGLLLRMVMAHVSGESLGAGEDLKTEVFFEEIGLNPLKLVQKLYEANNQIVEFGMGTTRANHYLKFLSAHDPAKFDFGIFYTFDESEVQRKYLNNGYSDFNRNLNGFRIGAILELESDRSCWPANLLNNQETVELINRLSPNSTSDSQIIEIDNQKFIAQALIGETSHDLRFLSFYPVARIKERIHDKYTPVFWLWISITLISFWFSLFLSRTISEPVKELKRGVSALGNRDFAVTLPDLGDNEFGHLGRVFNQTLNDLEELQIAGFVQEKLLPQMTESMHHGQIRIYGKTVSLNDLGGDYFDIIKHQDLIGIVIGDVAGHGVAASLIMAFVKACIIKLEKLYARPLELVNRLNLLFRKTRNKKQRKFMSFQYLLFKKDANFEYVNAGHCFPILVDSVTKTATPLKMIGSPLGATSKDIKEVQNHRLNAGQALILYSDGYYETGELGFERFCDILVESYQFDPKDYFAAINNNIRAHLNHVAENDDKTLIVVSSVSA